MTGRADLRRAALVGGPSVSGTLLALLVGVAAAQAPPPAGFPGTAPPAPPAEIVSFRSEPEEVAPGAGATLHWEGINAYSLRIEPDIGPVATRGSRSVFPTATTTYTLTLTGPGGEHREAVTVRVTDTAEATATRDDAGAASADASADAASDGLAELPRLPDGKPDLSGVYLGGRDIRLVGDIELLPGAESYRVPPSDEDLGQGALCLPPGVPAATMVPYPLQIVARPDVVVILYEAYNLFRIVRIDQRIPDDMDPLWMGYSVGRWEGDTLVVETGSFNDKTLVSGHRHTEAMHVEERYTRTGIDTIDYRASVSDPNVFAAPVEYRGDLTRHPEWEIGEYVCAENNKDYSELFE